MKLSYRQAGVDIDAGNHAVDLIKEKVRSTFGPQVLTGIGGFGSLFAFSGYREPVLVSSADGVGTKLKVAFAMDRHDTVGADLVSHCVNDILTCGAMPLFFLDYVAMGKLFPEKVAAIVSGLADGCRAAGCALVGGETAEMPGLYAEGEYDLAGFIVGAVERDRVVDGSRMQAGDTIWGFASSGLHTNGYSLARRVFEEEPLDRVWPELGRSLGDELLAPHRCYLPYMRRLLGTPSPYPLPEGEGGAHPPLFLGEVARRAGEGATSALPAESVTRPPVDVRAMAHITGGGIPGNVSRVIPAGKKAVFRWGSWPVLPIFPLIQQMGGIDQEEMLRVFNMGLGFVFICPPEDAGAVRRLAPEAMVVGEIVATDGEERVEVVDV